MVHLTNFTDKFPAAVVTCGHILISNGPEGVAFADFDGCKKFLLSYGVTALGSNFVHSLASKKEEHGNSEQKQYKEKDSVLHYQSHTGYLLNLSNKCFIILL
jgi:hypothetical protein